jgi:predicted TPR repeat methyltransferase
MNATDQPAAHPLSDITIDEAMRIALECLKRDELTQAETICQRILASVPDYADAIHYRGVLAHKMGRSEEGIALIRRSLELVPGQADWHSNLGIVLQATDDLEGAIHAFTRAIELQPSHANAHNNVGVLLRVFGRLDEAERVYRKAIELDPGHGDAYHNLAIVLDLMGRTPEAVNAYCKAITLRPYEPETRRMLALAYCHLGRADLAVQLCEEWMRLEPDNPMARHALASCSGRDVPPRASDDYVRIVFDSFATTFEAKLARLHYRAPDLVARALAGTGIEPGGTLDVLDAGCGTGLCAALLAPYARRLVGVDLSRGMLQHARAKQLYDELVEGELTAYLRQHPQTFDAIASADTLVYFGALEPFARAAADSLRDGGVVVFTVEEAGEQEPDDFTLQPHGRYTHKRPYVERVLAACGLVPVITGAELRQEAGRPVAGLVVRATKQAGEHHA